MRRLLALAAVAALTSSCAGERTLGGSFHDIGAGTSLRSGLLFDGRHDYSDVDVTLRNGRLLLTGTMRTEEGRAVLDERARTVKGVHEVIDAIVIGDRRRPGETFEDARIHQEIGARWVASRTVDSRNFKISVVNGVVYVLGEARDENERAAALSDAQTVKGVRQVVSYVTLLFPAAAN